MTEDTFSELPVDGSQVPSKLPLAVPPRGPQHSSVKWKAEFKPKLKAGLPVLRRKQTPTKMTIKDFLATTPTLPGPAKQSRRWSNVHVENEREVFTLLHNIEIEKESRRRGGVTKELKEIKKRVKRHLDNIGMSFDDLDEKEGICLPPIFDAKAEREKMDHQVTLMENIDKFLEKSLTRKEYITELDLWFTDNLNMCHDLTTKEEFSNMLMETHNVHKSLLTILGEHCGACKGVVYHGKALLQEADKMHKERMAQMSKKTRKEKMIIFDDKALAKDQIKWESACKNVLNVFDDAQKMMKNLFFKNALKLGQTQYHYQIVCAEKRFKETDDKRRQCMDLQGKMHAAKYQAEKLNKEIEDYKDKVTVAQCTLSEARHQVQTLKERETHLTYNVSELNAKIDFLHKEMNRPKTPPPVQASPSVVAAPPPPTPEPQQVIVKVVDSTTEARLFEIEEKLKLAKAQLASCRSRLSDMDHLLRDERTKNKELLEQIAEQEAAAARSPTPIPSPELPQLKDPIPDEPPPTTQPEKETGYYKTLLKGMKMEFSQEVEKMKNYVKREKHRSEAGVRRVELQQKEHLAIIQKDMIRMLRAIMHFRDAMVGVLDKELLVDNSQALNKLGSLLSDKLSPDPRELLQVVLVNVVDYLSNMENVMGNAFLRMRELMKYQLEKQLEKQLEAEVAARQQKEKAIRETKKMVKDMGTQKKVLTKAKDDVGGMAKRLKKTKNRISKYQKMAKSEFKGDQKYDNLMKRYTHVWKLYKKMQKEMDCLQDDFSTTMQKKLEERETMLVSQFRFGSKRSQAINDQELTVTVTDQRHNLRMLCRAYEDKKLSKKLHGITTAMIYRTIEIPKLKLRTLFDQYITFRAVKASKERVKHLMLSEEIDPDTKKDMKGYAERMEGRLRLEMMNTSKQLNKLNDERRNMNIRMFHLFNEVLVQSGVHLVHPLLKHKKTEQLILRAASTMDKKERKKLLDSRPDKMKQVMKMPKFLEGSSALLQLRDQKDPQERVWPSNPDKETGYLPGIIAPHMQVYEINRPRITAVKSCKKAKTLLPKINGFSLKSESMSNMSVF